MTSAKIKKNSIKGSKVKNGSLKAADLVKEEKQKAVTTFTNGGQGDCIWGDATAVYPGTAGATYRKDRFGTVHLAGLAFSADGSGGDGDCSTSGSGGEAEDGIAFILPPGYQPAKNILMASGGSVLLIAGPNGFVGAGVSLPPGAVYGPAGLLLDGVSFLPAGSDVQLAKVKASGKFPGGDPLRLR